LVEKSSNLYYIETVVDASGDRVDRGRPGAGTERPREQLRGVVCADLPDALTAAEAGAEFLVLRERMAMDDLVALCESVNLPVFARGTSLLEAWAAGATGVNGIVA
jgi:hypothetical protein